MVLHFTFCLPQHWQVTYSVRKSHGKASRRYVWWGATRILELHIKVYQHCSSPCVDLCGEGGAEHVDAELEVRLDAQHGQVVVADRLPGHRPEPRSFLQPRHLMVHRWIKHQQGIFGSGSEHKLSFCSGLLAFYLTFTFFKISLILYLQHLVCLYAQF